MITMMGIWGKGLLDYVITYYYYGLYIYRKVQLLCVPYYQLYVPTTVH